MFSDESDFDMAAQFFDKKSVPIKKLLMIGEAVKRVEIKESKLKRLAQLTSQLNNV